MLDYCNVRSMFVELKKMNRRMTESVCIRKQNFIVFVCVCVNFQIVHIKTISNILFFINLIGK